jgi:membrane fusion protein (multidrug efflux system)
MANNNSDAKEKTGQSPDSNNGGGAEKNTPLYLKKRVIIPIVLLLILMGAAVYWYVGTLGYVTTDDAYIDGNKLSVSAKILGRIEQLTVDEGDTVKQGQVLVRLDSTDFKAREAQAEAALALAKESINLAKVNLDKAQDDFNRAEKQYKGNVIPKEQYDHAQKALEAAKAQYGITKAKINEAGAQLNVIKTELNNTVIYSPMDGVVAKRWELKGDVVQPGQPIFTLYNLKNVWVTAQFQETDLASIQIGDTVQISVDTYPDHSFIGTVFQMPSNTASQFSLIPPDNASGNFTKVTQRAPVKISIKPEKSANVVSSKNNFMLLPGMSVEVSLKKN